MPPVAQLVAEPRHAGSLAGADLAGEARGGGGRVVQVGLWIGRGRVVRARYRATTCASLLAYAEAACALLEGGLAPDRLGPALRREVTDVHPSHLHRADVVVAAVRAAFHPEPS